MPGGITHYSFDDALEVRKVDCYIERRAISRNRENNTYFKPYSTNYQLIFEAKTVFWATFRIERAIKKAICSNRALD